MVKITKLKFFLSVLILTMGIFNVSATRVTLDLPSNISGGQMFDVNVIIDPEGDHIAGGQLDLNFDRSSILINSITEGNFLKQSGINTVFNSGTIDNSIGKAANIYAAILGNGNVTSPGTFIIINATSIRSIKTNDINLVNVLMVDTGGVQIYPAPTPISIVEKASIGAVSGGGSPGGGSGGATGEALQEPASSNKTLFILVFAGIIIILFLVYKYVLPKYSAPKGEIPSIEKQNIIVKTNQEELSSIIRPKASDSSIKNIAADTEISESGIKKARAARPIDREPIPIKKGSKKKKETDKGNGKTSA